MADPILVPRRRQDWFNDRGDLTLRALRFFESLTDATNSTSITIEGIEESQAISGARSVSQAAIFNQQGQHGESDSRIEALEVAPKVSQASIVNQRQQTNGLSDRIETVEIDLSTRPRVADIYSANQRIDELIDELIKEIRAIAPNVELENKALCLQVATLEQLKLLNLRTEEALETDLDEDDL